MFIYIHIYIIVGRGFLLSYNSYPLFKFSPTPPPSLAFILLPQLIV